jgi:hypothetical protein
VADLAQPLALVVQGSEPAKVVAWIEKLDREASRG